MKKCNEVMTKNPVCCLPTDSVKKAAVLMKRENIGSIPVVQPIRAWAKIRFYSRFVATIIVIVALLDISGAYSNVGKIVQVEALGESSLLEATGPLRVNPVNPRYFTDGSGKAIYLTGSHTWANFQDIGLTNPPVSFDYDAYLDFLQANNHNFFRLWFWEQSKWVLHVDSGYYVLPLPFQRTGPGNALDGQLKFDVTKFDQAYFDRMRARIIAAGNKGIYVSIMLFDGFSVDCPKGQFTDCTDSSPANPWRGHPFNASNNINSINGDPNNDQSGSETHTLQIPAITIMQEAYIKKVIDTVNDLDNVLYEISNESNSNSQDWQYHMINYIKNYEVTKLKQHPIGMTVEYPNGSNTELFSSPADWISPNGDTGNYMTDPDAASGNKVIIVDSDHLWGEGGDRIWVWKSFTRGLNLLYMDCYQASFCTGPIRVNSPTRLSLIANMGYVRNYADRIDLEGMIPQQSGTNPCSTGFCLYKTGLEYLVYRSSSSGSVTINLTAASGQLLYEWFNPANGNVVGTGTTMGGASRTFTSPFSGDAVLYIYRSTFADVPQTYWSWDFIERLYKSRITGGCNASPLRYCPTTTVTRDQMAVFLLRGLHTSSYFPPPAVGIFQDVPSDYWAADWIEQLAAEGITSGCDVSPPKYCPTVAVTRDQMAIFLLRARHGSDYIPPQASGVFQDVPSDYWAADWIEQLAAEGITSGCSTTPKMYCPTTTVTRDQMAVFLVRTFNLP